MALDKVVDSTLLNANLTSIANTIRSKTGKSTSIEFPDGYINEIKTLQSPDGVWVKPNDWPDIEILPISADATMCLYMLYDCRTEVRYADFEPHNIHTISYAKYINGVLQSRNSITGGALDLPDDCDYIVIKIESQNNTPRVVFAKDSNKNLFFVANNIGSNQPCVWMYGKIGKKKPL